MTGSTQFLIEDSDNFKRSFKKLAKVHDASLVELVADTLSVKEIHQMTVIQAFVKC